MNHPDMMLDTANETGNVNRIIRIRFTLPLGAVSSDTAGGGASDLETSAQDRMSKPVGSREFTTATGVTSGATGILERRAPVLFLDYDNVLHPCDAFRTRHRIRPADSDATLVQFAPLLDEMLSPYPELRIVLTTSWVEVLGFTRARDRLPLNSLRERVIGATYHSRDPVAHLWDRMARGAQVRRYVDRHRLQHWLAIDDRDDGFEGVEEHLVKCRAGVGLGEGDVRSRLADRLSNTCPTRSSL